MGDNVRLGRVAGIEINASWSLLLIGRVTTGSGRRALVLDEDGRLVGIVTAHDIDRVLEIAELAGPDALAAAPTADR
jgi:CBS domain-containing protein